MPAPNRPPTGVLLVNLGTPDSPEVADVRRYLREFLSDPRVIDLPAPARWLLLHAVILPFRPRRAAAAYRQIWTDEGSPLLVHGRALAAGVTAELGDAYQVELGMRYGSPSIGAAVHALVEAGVERIVAVPLFPQRTESSFGSAVARIEACVDACAEPPTLEVLAPFCDDPAFIGALSGVAARALEAFRPDHVLFSYHGLPERHVRREDPTGRTCFASERCCDVFGDANRSCYRAQCFATTRATADALSLPPEGFSTSFQSRLGRARWILPDTVVVLPELAARGVRRLAVLCPSFVADCLETVEEIGIRAREQWRELGGEELLLVPCVNAEPAWVAAVADRVRSAVP